MASSASLDAQLNRTSFPSSLPPPHTEDAHPLPPDVPPQPSALVLAMLEGDRFVTRVLKVLATPAGTDRVLCTSTYTLQLLSAIINRRLDNATEKIAQQFAESASKALLPGEALVATFQPPPIAALLARVSISSKKLASLISEYRIFMRLWGLLGIYAWGKSVALAPPKDTVLRLIAYTQVSLNACFQFLENRAFLAGKGIVSRDGKKQLQDWCWSSRFWMAHTLLEFVRLFRQRQIFKAEEAAARADANEGADGKGKAVAEGEGAWWKDDEKAKRAEAQRLWWKDVIVNAAYFPMTIHWSLETGLLNDLQIGILGSIAGGMGLREVWRKTG